MLFCLRIHDNNYIDNIINLSVSLPLEDSDCEKRGTGGKDWVKDSGIASLNLLNVLLH